MGVFHPLASAAPAVEANTSNVTLSWSVCNSSADDNVAQEEKPERNKGPDQRNLPVPGVGGGGGGGWVHTRLSHWGDPPRERMREPPQPWAILIARGSCPMRLLPRGAGVVGGGWWVVLPFD